MMHPESSSVRSFFTSMLLMVLFSTQVQGQNPALPAQPWPNSRSITVSFAPDFVEIGRYRNELFMHLNSQMGAPDWQIEILRAFQHWSRVAGVQFAVASDSPRAFGTPGLSQSDPRFGDIRLGAFPQTNVLGNVISFHPAHGSWSGDIFLDTSRQFYIHDWSSSPNFNDQYDLFTVALHEIGNSLGLVDTDRHVESVMYSNYIGPRNGLSTLDISQIQSLYGSPLADDLEPQNGNETFSTATSVDFPADFSQTLFVSQAGRIASPVDADVYRMEATSLAENCWIKLRARGRSLLCAQVTAYDEQLNEITTFSAENPLENNIVKEITGLSPGEIIYIVVQASGVPDFDFGDYQLELDFNPHGNLEQLEEGDDDDGESPFFEADDRELLNELYTETGLIDAEIDRNNSFRNADNLLTAPGFALASRFETISSIASSTDADMYRIQTSRSARGSMVIELNPLSVELALLDLQVFDASKNPVKTRIRYRENGDVFVEVPRIRQSAIYFVRVNNRAGNKNNCNYLLLMHLSETTGKLQTIENFQLTANASDQFGIMTIYKTQLYRIDLSMSTAGPTTQAAQLTIYSDSGRVELATSVRPGQDSVNFVWLHAGEHYLRITARTLGTASVLPSTIVVKGGAVSDDKGPILVDPSGNPITDPQSREKTPTPIINWAFPVTYSWLYQLRIPADNPWL